MIITDTRDDHEYVYDVKTSENRSLERAGFERYTNYTVSIGAYTIKGLGNFSEPIRVITDEDGMYDLCKHFQANSPTYTPLFHHFILSSVRSPAWPSVSLHQLNSSGYRMVNSSRGKSTWYRQNLRSISREERWSARGAL